MTLVTVGLFLNDDRLTEIASQTPAGSRLNVYCLAQLENLTWPVSIPLHRNPAGPR